MSDIDRCPECGSWMEQCVFEAPRQGCGCARCLSNALTRMKVERDALVDDLHQEQKWRIESEDEIRELQTDLEWIEQVLFERKWSGTLGEPSYWQLVGSWRHIVQRMRGETLSEAIDEARNQP